MSPPIIYLCDADCVINLHRHFGRKAISALRRSAKKSELKLPEGVVREIIRGTDNLAKVVEKEQRWLLVNVGDDSSLRAEIARLERDYGETIVFGQHRYSGFWKSKAGKQAADAQVVAVAKLLRGVAVSDDQAVKLVYALEGVPCIGWSEFARRLGLVKPETPKLPGLGHESGEGV